MSLNQFSLPTFGEITEDTMQVWLGLPKTKYDPELSSFEPENGNVGTKDNSREPLPETQKLSLVTSSAYIDKNVNSEEIDKLDHNPRENGENDKTQEQSINNKQSMIAKVGYCVKMSLLVACWIFFTSVFILYNEKEEIERNTYIPPGEIKSYPLKESSDRIAVLVQISGPFLPDYMEKRLSLRKLMDAEKLMIWLESSKTKTVGSEEAFVDKPSLEKREETFSASKQWSVSLQPEQFLDFSKGERRSTILTLSPSTTSSNVSTVYNIRMKTTSSTTIPLTMSYTVDPIEINSGVLYSCLLLCGLYGLIIFEIVNRTMAAIFIASTSLAVLALIGERPSMPELISWLDVETLLLLFSMMLLVSITAETGIFDYLAVFTFEVTKARLWPMVTLLCAITGFLSTFLDNVTTVMLMTPVTIRLCKVMDLHPIPILISMVLFSNIGGTTTPVGDPPNVIIASNKAVIQSGINFTNFTLHMTPGILLICVQTYYQLRYIYRDSNKLFSNERVQDLRHQILGLRHAIDSLPDLSDKENEERENLERKMAKLNHKLTALKKKKIHIVFSDETFQRTLIELKEKYKIRDKALFIKSSIAVSFVVVVFFLHSIPELNRVSLGWTALLGAILLLTLSDPEDLEPILQRVEWSTLLFFASLFVLMEALSKLGLIQFIGNHTNAIILKVDENSRLAVALLLMLWVSGVASAFVDNIPLTTMMVRVVTTLGSNPQLGLPMAPLIWALSFGACLGGNGTLIGASANVVCAGVAEQHGYRFTFMQFFRVGFPVMLGHLSVASFYLLICHYVFSWH